MLGNNTIVIMYKLWSNDRFGFKVEKTHYYLFFFAEKKHLIIIFIYLCGIARGIIERRIKQSVDFELILILRRKD